MQEHNNFDQILDFLCSGIMSKRERQSVRDELYDHLMCKYETNLAVGMDEEKAAESAINDLGNKNELKENLQKVHWYYPAQSLKSAINILVIGLIAPLVMVVAGLFPFMIEYASALGLIAVTVKLVATYIMRTANEKFRYAFVCDVISTVSYILLTALEPVIYVYDKVVLAIFIVTFIIPIIISFICVFSGLKDLVRPYSDIKIVMQAQRCCYLIYTWLFMCVLSLDDLSSGLTPFYIVCIIVWACCFIFEMLRISDVLYKSDHEYKVQISVKRRYVICLLVFALSAVSIGTVDYFVSTAKPSEVPYTIEDCVISQEEYDRICGNLISYGIPEEYVRLLPKSEIVNYWNSVNKSELTKSAREIYGSGLSGFPTTFDLEACSGPIIVQNYAVGLYENSNEIAVRFIKIFRIPREYEDKLKSGYIDCIVFDDSNINEGAYEAPKNNDNRGDLLLNLYMDDSSVYKRGTQQLYLEPDDYKNYQHVKGIKFKADPGTVIIYATTRKISDINSTEANFGYTYFHQKRPIMFPVRTLESIVKMQEYVSIEKNYYEYISDQVSYMLYNDYDSQHRWVMPGYEYNLPADEQETEETE